MSALRVAHGDEAIQRQKLGLGLALVALVAASCSSVTERDDVDAGGQRDAIVETQDGPVRGTATDAYTTFQGIPYAAPPVGELRWQPPRPVTPWSDPLDATAFRSPCTQGRSDVPDAIEVGEDCLYLNVATPRRRPGDAARPVMVWLHGGGFSGGTANEYDPRRLAVRGDVMVVTVEFRLGIFGFLGLPGLPGSGTFGIEDQQAALQWVRANAEAFGGDPDNVTVFGESGGALGVCALLTSPAAAGLFDKAILQSGSCLGVPPILLAAGELPAGQRFPEPRPAPDTFGTPLAEVEAVGRAAAGALGCPTDGGEAGTIECLREISADDLLAMELRLAQERRMTFGEPAHGGTVLPRDPAELLRGGDFHPVPILSGHTRDEARLATAFVVHFSRGMSEDDHADLLDAAFGDRSAQVRQRYAPADHGSPAAAWAALETDRSVCRPAYDAYARHVPAYIYEFADRNAPPYLPPQLHEMLFPKSYPAGASQASELSYLFDLLLARPAYELDPRQRQLGDLMIDYWARFAHTGDPNGPGLPEWPRYRVGEGVPHVQSLAPEADGIQPVDLAAEHQCDFWASM